MKKIILSLIILFAIHLAQAQNQPQFFGKVKIEFVKTVNVHASYKSMDSRWYDQIKERLPKESITYHQFIGDSTRSIYKPGKETEYDSRSWFRPIAVKMLFLQISNPEKQLRKDRFLRRHF